MESGSTGQADTGGPERNPVERSEFRQAIVETTVTPEQEGPRAGEEPSRKGDEPFPAHRTGEKPPAPREGKAPPDRRAAEARTEAGDHPSAARPERLIATPNGGERIAASTPADPVASKGTTATGEEAATVEPEEVEPSPVSTKTERTSETEPETPPLPAEPHRARLVGIRSDPGPVKATPNAAASAQGEKIEGKAQTPPVLSPDMPGAPEEPGRTDGSAPALAAAETEAPVENTVGKDARGKAESVEPHAPEAAGHSRRHGEHARQQGGERSGQEGRQGSPAPGPIQSAKQASAPFQPEIQERVVETLETSAPDDPAPVSGDADARAPGFVSTALQEGINGPKDAAGMQAAFRARFNAEWARLLGEGPLRLQEFENGWKSVDIQLAEGEGTVNVRARRDEDRVAVAVAFSDPALRQAAAADANRLREILQQQYGTRVDLTLTGDSAGRQFGAPESGATGRSGRRGGQGKGPAPVESSLARRSGPISGSREWIG